MIMWCENLPNGKVRYVERYEHPLTGQMLKTSVTMDKDTKANQKKAYGMLQQKIGKSTSIAYKTESVTLAELTEKYLDEQKATLKASTYRRNTFMCKQILSVFGDNLLTDRLNAPYIREKLVSLEKTGKQKNELLKRFKGVLKWGYTHDYISDISYLDKIEKFQAEPHKESISDKFLEASELRTLTDAMEHPLWKDVTLFLALSGLRFGELAALRKIDIDMNSRLIRISRTYDPNNKIVTDAKTETSIREVYIQDELLIVVRRINLQMKKFSLATGVSSELFIFDPNGDYVKYYTYNKYLQENAQKSLCRAISPHTLRHTHASLLMENGVDIETISRRLGHNDSQITRQIYLHITERLKEKDNERLRALKIL